MPLQHCLTEDGQRRLLGDRRGLPYAAHDSAAAHDYVARLINIPNAPPWMWEQLFTPERIEQTYRALVAAEQNAQAQYARRRADAYAIKQAWQDNPTTAGRDAWYAANTNYLEWKARVAHFRRAVQTRLIEAREIRQHLRDSRSEHEAWDLLRALVEAIAAHQAQTEGAGFESTTADRLLWSRLDLLRLPMSDKPIRKLASEQPREPLPGDTEELDTARS